MGSFYRFINHSFVIALRVKTNTQRSSNQLFFFETEHNTTTMTTYTQMVFDDVSSYGSYEDDSDDDVFSNGSDVFSFRYLENDEPFLDGDIHRLTKLPNVWCPLRGTFVFSETSSDSMTGDSGSTASSSPWTETEKTVVVPLTEIFRQQTMEQKEEEERQAFLREQAAIRENERLRRRFGQRNRYPYGYEDERHRRNGHYDNRRRPPPYPRRHEDQPQPRYRKDNHPRNGSNQGRDHHHHSATSRNKPGSSPTDEEGFVTVSYSKQKSNREPTRSNKPVNASNTGSHRRNGEVLCHLPARHNAHCQLVHRLQDWQPRRCHNPSNCYRGNACAFWHVPTETREAYLTRAIRYNVSFFQKQKDEYISTYRLRNR